MMRQKIEKTADEKMWNRISQIPVVVLVLLSGIDIVRFAILGDKTAFITFSMIAVTFMLVAYMAWKSKMPFLYLVIAARGYCSHAGRKPGDNGDDLEKNPYGACGSFTACGSSSDTGRISGILESKV